MDHVNRVKIGDVFDVETGSTPSTAVPEYWEGGQIKWITPLDLGRLRSTYICKTSRNITQKGLENSSAKLVPAESIIISTRAPIGYLAVLAEPMAFNQGCKALLRKETNSVAPLFIYYQLQTKIQEMNRLGSGSTFKEISKEKLENIELRLPPLAMQRQVAAVLVKADAARERRRQASQLTEQFLQSAFLEMFGDPVTNPNGWRKGILGEAIEYSEYGTSVKSNEEKRGYPVLGMGNVTSAGLLDLDDLKYVELPDNEFEKLRLRYGDIIFNRTNSTELVGKTARWNLEMDAVVASYLVKLRLTGAFDSAWFSALLNSNHYKKLFMQRCKKAVGQSNISPTLLKEFPMYMPPLAEQQKFAALVQKVESLRAKQKESEKELENLFNSLMQRAFRGELVQ